MEFRLLYEGEIAPRKRASLWDIHAIRKSLDPQLRELWGHHPLSKQADLRLRHQDEIPSTEIGVLERRANLVFAPLVTKRLDVVCHLHILFLRRQAPGQLISEGGDI